MTKTQRMEMMVGVFMVAGMAALFMLAIKVSNMSAFSEGESYEIVAQFENIGGLKVRSPVTMAGVRIGRVTAISIDTDRFEAIVHLSIDKRYNALPSDTSASIFTSGVLGENYVGLEAGGSETPLRAGDTIKITQSAVVLEQLIGQFLVNKTTE